VTLCDPAFKDEVLKVALPPLRLPVPSTVGPLLNVTISPFGGEPLTVAVKVTACPYVDGLEFTVVVVAVPIHITQRHGIDTQSARAVS
jgi:hypothetical protein